MLATFITIGSTSGAELRGIKKAANLHPSRTIVGGFFAMLGCSILAEFAPSAGAYLAILVSGVAFFTYGLPAIEGAGIKWSRNPAVRAKQEQELKQKGALA